MRLASSLFAAALAILAAAEPALANGRPAATSTINFRRGHDTDILAGLTFGLVISHDSGATWHWMCEDAVHYSGVYDPIYNYTEPGSIFATTFNGALVMRDGCNFNPSVFGEDVFVTTMSQGADGSLYAALSQPANPSQSDPGDAKVYVSHDDGATFPISANPGQLNDWWETMVAAPSNPMRIYLSGYRLSGQGRTELLFRSDNGGTSYTPLSQTDLQFTDNSTFHIADVSKTDPDLMYMKVDFPVSDSVLEEAVYKTTDGGAHWTKIVDENAKVSFLVRANGDVVYATQAGGVKLSHDKGATWLTQTQPDSTPHVNCLAENIAGEVWACTQNFGVPGVPSDNAGIMKSTDLTTWTTVLRYQDIAGPVDCAAGTLQHDTCVGTGLSNWCALHDQLGITANPTCCAPVTDGQPVTPGCEQPGGDGSGGSGGGDGCCESSASTAGTTTALLSSIVIGGVLLSRRRRRS
ncbi:MAG TPA: hypothetical protein VGM39_21625 [Kofleriaceae bacterium]|jgi:hypothetical protein